MLVGPLSVMLIDPWQRIEVKVGVWQALSQVECVVKQNSAHSIKDAFNANKYLQALPKV